MNEENLIEMLKGNGITPETPSLLVAYVKRFSVANVNLARTATLLLWKFTDTAENRQQIIQNHGVTVILKLIYRYYTTDADITLKGFRTIYGLMPEGLIILFIFTCCILEETKNAIISHKGIELIKLCLLHYVEHDVTLVQTLFLIIKGFSNHGFNTLFPFFKLFFRAWS
jgi:hypothetical protein